MSMLTAFKQSVAATVFGCVVALSPATAEAEPLRVAFGDIPSVETLHLLIAFERAKEAGLEMEVTYLKSEDIAAQAVVSGQADVGVGGPYSLIQKVRAPVRMFMQLSTLQMYPVVAADTYKTWKDLDGQEVAVHSRGSGTEAIMRLAAQKNGIEYSNISYIPGSEVRSGALLQGNVKATIVDASGKRFLEAQAPGKFLYLPLDDLAATDEGLFANTDYLKEHPAEVATLVEAILATWREVAKDPAAVERLREQYKLLPDASPEMVAEIGPYFAEAAAGGLPLNGGGEEAVKDDFDFYTTSGALEGEASALKVEDFWEFAPLKAALTKLGQN